MESKTEISTEKYYESGIEICRTCRRCIDGEMTDAEAARLASSSRYETVDDLRCEGCIMRGRTGDE